MNRMKRGQTFLALVFLIGGVVILIGLTLVFLANTFVDTGYGYQASIQAEAVAASGVRDALLLLGRISGASLPGSYTVPVGSSTATVTITQNSPSAGLITVLSTATVSNRARKISVVAAIDASTGQVSVISWQATQ